MEVGGVVVDTGPPAAGNGARQRGNRAADPGSEMGDFWLGQGLGVVVGIARREDVLRRADQGDTADIWPQVNLARQVKPYRVQAQATTKIVGAAQRDHGVTGWLDRQDHTQRPHQGTAPDIGCHYHYRSLYISLAGLYAHNMAPLSEYARGRGALGNVRGKI